MWTTVGIDSRSPARAPAKQSAQEPEPWVLWCNIPRNKISMTSALIARPRHLGFGVTDFSAQPSKKRNVNLRQEGFDPAGHSFESRPIHWPRSACWNMGIGPLLQPTCTSVVCPVQRSASDPNRKPPSQPLPRTRARAIKGATHTYTDFLGQADMSGSFKLVVADLHQVSW